MQFSREKINCPDGLYYCLCKTNKSTFFQPRKFRSMNVVIRGTSAETTLPNAIHLKQNAYALKVTLKETGNVVCLSYLSFHSHVSLTSKLFLKYSMCKSGSLELNLILILFSAKDSTI